MKMKSRNHARILTHALSLVLTAAVLSIACQTLWAQQTPDPEPVTPRLVLPMKKEPAGEQLNSRANIPATVPGSLEDVNNKLEALTERIDGVETKLERSLARLERAYQQLQKSTQKPQCTADLQVSMDPVSGAKDACKPYACNKVEGLCRTSCRDTSDCASGAVCNNSHCTFAR